MFRPIEKVQCFPRSRDGRARAREMLLERAKGKADATMASKQASNKTSKSAVKHLSPKVEAKVKAGRKAGGDRQEYLTYTLKDVMISGY